MEAWASAILACSSAICSWWAAFVFPCALAPALCSRPPFAASASASCISSTISASTRSASIGSLLRGAGREGQQFVRLLRRQFLQHLAERRHRVAQVARHRRVVALVLRLARQRRAPVLEALQARG